MRPVGPDIGFPLAAILQELQAAVTGLQAPPFVQALTDLPSADTWEGRTIYVRDEAKLALSNGATWTDTTGGVL